jgi:signal transduction histidine kinase
MSVPYAGLVGADEFLAAVLQTVAQPICAVDADGLIRFASPTAAAALGYAGADELLGRPWPAREPPAGAARGDFTRADGATCQLSFVAAPLPEGRGTVVAFTDMVELARGQAALNRLAALVRRGEPAHRIYAAIAGEVAGALQVPRIELSRDEGGVIAAVGDDVGAGPRAEAPIMIDGRVWGVLAACASDPLPEDAATRLAGLTDVAATVIGGIQARDRLRVLAAEQSALQRVATLVAEGAESEAVFNAVAAEIGGLAGTPMVMLSRDEHDGTATVVGALGDHPFQPGVRWTLDGPSLQKTALETGESARTDEVAGGEGTIADASREYRLHSRVAVPILVDGRVWGVIGTGRSGPEPLPDDIETRLTAFTDLLATAIANTQAREDLRRLADEQAALRRVATLVAHGSGPNDVFGAVAREVAELLDLPMVEMARYDAAGTATVIGATGDHPFQPGTTWVLDGPSLTGQVRASGRTARVDSYEGVSGMVGAASRAGGVHAGVAAPIFVDGELWGVLAAGGGPGVRLAPDAEERLDAFTELVEAALSNAQARDDLGRLAEEQAALRRIATLVAHGAEPRVVFDAVARETGSLLGATTVNLVHFTDDDINVTMAGWSTRGIHVPVGTRLSMTGGETINTLVRATAAPGRFDSYEDASGELASRLRELGIRSEIGAPVIVERAVWGALIAGTDAPEPLRPGTETRLAGFAELVGTAIANAEARTELIESRARIVQSADEQRRRVVRDLHDGAQQRLVHAIMTLQRAQSAGDDLERLHRLVGEALAQAREATNELRELAHGIHPALLTHRGLRAAVEALADRAPVPVDVVIPEQRHPSAIESAAYFIAAEALTNVAKYADATTARVEVTHGGETLVIEVADDGVGGAEPYPGSGLSGLQDRVAAVAGELTLESPPGQGTRLRAVIPSAPPTTR